MRTLHLPIVTAVVLSTGMLFAATGVASAQKAQKVTYEQAWEKCSADVKANVSGSEQISSSQRYSRGAACMKKFGYRLKK